MFRSDTSGQIITTSAEVTLNGGLIRELPQNPLNSGLGIIVICPDTCLSGSRCFFFLGGGWDWNRNIKNENVCCFFVSR